MPPETATPIAPAPTPVMISMTETERLIQREASITLDDMPVSYAVVGADTNPIVDPKLSCHRLPRGKEVWRPTTIVDVNGPKYDSEGKEIPGTARFKYAWLSDEDKIKPMYSGYTFVRDDNEGSRGVNGEKIQDHYFTNHVIRMGSCHLHFCKAGYADGLKEEYRRHARLIAQSLGSSGSAQATDDGGNPVAGVMLGAPEDNNRRKR